MAGSVLERRGVMMGIFGGGWGRMGGWVGGALGGVCAVEMDRLEVVGIGMARSGVSLVAA